MPTNFKALIVVLPVSLLIFYLAKRIALRFCTESDYRRRRNIWLTLTIVAFVSPMYLGFLLIAVPLLIWGARRDANPIAFYFLLLQVIPQVPWDIPRLFPLDMYRLLAVCVLIPCIWRGSPSKESRGNQGLRVTDVLIIAYGVLQIVFYVPPDTADPTYLHNTMWNSMRMAALYFIDVYAIYYATSRYSSNYRLIADSLAALWLSGAIMAPLAIFETAYHWLLYGDFDLRWTGLIGNGVYLMRGETLRAQVAAGHSLALGYLLAIAYAVWLFLQTYAKTFAAKVYGFLLLWFGLIAAYGRGPWIGAAAIYLIYSVIQPSPFRRLWKAAGLAIIGLLAIALGPLRDRIAAVLPFMGGSVDAGSITYRQDLATQAWTIIMDNPMFGDQFAYRRLESLRQGQHIIDLVNTYASVTLFHGFVGLALFLGPLLYALYGAFVGARQLIKTDPECYRLGIILCSCIVGTMVMIGSCSLIFALPTLFYALTGLGVAYTFLARRNNPMGNSVVQQPVFSGRT
jgi:hypothetical protein